MLKKEEGDTAVVTNHLYPIPKSNNIIIIIFSSIKIRIYTTVIKLFP